MIKLTLNNTKKPLFVNARLLTAMLPDSPGTHIVMSNGVVYHVAQTSDQIIALINV